MKSHHIITNKNKDKIFLIKKNGFFVLPSYSIKKISNTKKKLREITGLNTNILYPAISDYENDFFIFVSVCQYSSDNSYGEFFDINNLPEFELKKYVLEWSKYKDKKFNLPWFNAEWFEETKKYLKNKYGYKNISLFYLSSISCVLKIKLKDKNIFYKQVLKGLFEQEILLTKVLSDISSNTPVVIDYDNEKGYLILEDFGTKTLWDFNDIEIWCKTIKKYAQIQKLSIQNKEFLKNIQLFDRRVSNLTKIFNDITSNKTNLYLGKKHAIDEQEYKTLLALAPKIDQLCKNLKSFNIPDTIEHGDLHPFNVAIQNKSPIFYDWSDCSYSHPFFTMRVFTYAFFDKNGNELKNVPFIKNCDYPYKKIVEAYLEEWEDLESKENLIKIFEISMILVHISFIHQYHLLISAMEEHTRHIFFSYITKGVRRLIKSVSLYV